MATSNVPPVTEADIQYLTSLDEEFLTPVIDYSKLVTTNPISDEHKEVLNQLYDNIAKYAEIFSKIPDANLTAQIDVISKEYPHHNIEAHCALWCAKDEKAPSQGIFYECNEEIRRCDLNKEN